MKVAYADPPYIGCAKYYAEKTEVDHKELIDRLCRDFDSWALSASSSSLKQVLSYCPDDVRVGAWVKPFCSFKPNVNPAYAWEPVIFWHPRKRTREELTVQDWHRCPITLRKGLTGAKPQSFCYWLFELIGLQPKDEFTDLYPGTRAVTKAYEKWKQSLF